MGEWERPTIDSLRHHRAEAEAAAELHGRSTAIIWPQRVLVDDGLRLGTNGPGHSLAPCDERGQCGQRRTIGPSLLLSVHNLQRADLCCDRNDATDVFI